MQINLDDIKVTKRIRKDNGDISSFADNINEIRLLHPIVINKANELLCGHRRVLAFKKLQRKQIPCTKVNLVSLDKAYKQIVKHEKLQEFLQTPVNSITDDSSRLIDGDMQNESLQVPDNSVHLIFTDPPYDEKSSYLYDSLALHGYRVLKAGGSLVTYGGHYAIPKIIQYMETRNLHYYWIFAVVHTGPFSSFFAKNILVKWKPLLWFVKTEQATSSSNNLKVKPKTQNGKIFDLIESTRPNKIVHDHEQSSDDARYVIEQLTKPGDTVFDPIMGSGTTGIAALNLRRQFIGIEINPASFELAKVNVAKHHIITIV